MKLFTLVLIVLMNMLTLVSGDESKETSVQRRCCDINKGLVKITCSSGQECFCPASSARFSFDKADFSNKCGSCKRIGSCPDNEEKIQSNLIKDVQDTLKARGYDPGQVNGVLGPNTEKALKAYQSQNNLEADGALSNQTLQSPGLR